MIAVAVSYVVLMVVVFGLCFCLTRNDPPPPDTEPKEKTVEKNEDLKTCPPNTMMAEYERSAEAYCDAKKLCDGPDQSRVREGIRKCKARAEFKAKENGFVPLCSHYEVGPRGQCAVFNHEREPWVI